MAIRPGQLLESKRSWGAARLTIAGVVAAAMVVLMPSTGLAARAWGVVSSPNQSTFDELKGVACTSSTSCIAVGFYFDQSLFTDRTLVESSNGREWSIIASPNQGTANNDLYAVSCASSTRCMAVGRSGNGSLVETWNGSTWGIVASPNQGTGINALSGVSCTSSTSCVAVGSYYTGSNVAQTLVESWNGSVWTIIASPNQGTSSNLLTGIACTGPSNCVAVGNYTSAPSVDQTLAESWNGTVWSIVGSPNQGTSSNFLTGIACSGSISCVAVGLYYGTAATQTLVESWNGVTWTIIASPNQGTGSNSLNAVSCTGSTGCVAVGDYYNASDVDQTLIESWNGTAWTIVASPNEGTAYMSDALIGVACTSTGSCTAVGDYNSRGAAQTLIEAGKAPPASQRPSK